LIDAKRHADNVAAVFGPMKAIYRTTAPYWLKQGDFHSTSVVFVDGEIRTGYTTNTLIDLHHPAVNGKRFDLALGKSGGEDTDFFDRIYQDGGRFTFAADAIVEEELAVDRETLRWFLRRRFRSGQTHGRILARRSTMVGRVFHIGLAGFKAIFCLVMAFASFLKPIAWRRWLMRGALHVGVIAYLLGQHEATLYGAKQLQEKA
jgi:succinoglycan biosynthesis protein ExoM